jgi:hypothetical protein
MKLFKIALLSLVVGVGSNATAQKGKTPLQPKAENQVSIDSPAEKVQLTPEQKADRLTNKMEKQLELTATQKMKVSELNQGIAQKNEAIRNDKTITPQQKKDRINANKEQSHAMLKEMLDERQNVKLADWDQKKKVQREAQMEKRKELKGKAKPLDRPALNEDEDDL